MILGMWVLGGGGGSSSRVVTSGVGGTPAQPAGKGRLGLELVVVLLGRQFSRLVVGVGVVGVGPVRAQWAVVGVVGPEVAVGC